MPIEAPTFLLAYANDNQIPQRYLRNLKKERAWVREALRRAELDRRCSVIELTDATIGQLLDTFQQAGERRIEVFHFAGHAGNASLFFESSDGEPREADATGLAEFIGQHEELKLVFLNGCSSVPQVEKLLAAGVSAVIATSQDIKDEIAAEFAKRFYTALGGGRSVGESFSIAESAVRTQMLVPFNEANRRSADSRGFVFLEELDGTSSVEERPWPWELHAKTGAADWSLNPPDTSRSRAWLATVAVLCLLILAGVGYAARNLYRGGAGAERLAVALAHQKAGRDLEAIDAYEKLLQPKVLSNAEQQEEARVALSRSLAYVGRTSDAIATIEEIDLTEANDVLAVRVHLEAGAAYAYAADYEKALSRLQKAEEGARRASRTDLRMLAIVAMADLALDRSSKGEAAIALEEADGLTTEDTYALARRDFAQGRLHYVYARDAQAMAAFESAQDQFKRLVEQRWGMWSLLQLAKVDTFVNEPGRSRDRLKAVLSYTAAVRDRRLQAEAELWLGNLNRNQGRFEEAIANYNRALSAADGVNAHRIQGDVYLGLARLADRQDDHQAALNYTNYGTVQYERAKNYPSLGKLLGIRGGIYAQIGNYDDARSAYALALSRYQEIGDPVGEAIIDFRIGELYREQAGFAEDKEEAAKFRAKALEHFERAVGLFPENNRATNNYANVLRATAELLVETKPERTDQLLDEAARIYQARSAGLGLANVALVRAYREYKRSEYSKAEEYALQAIDLYKQNKDLLGRGDACLILAQSRAGQADNPGARQWAKEAGDLFRQAGAERRATAAAKLAEEFGPSPDRSE